MVTIAMINNTPTAFVLFIFHPVNVLMISHANRTKAKLMININAGALVGAEKMVNNNSKSLHLSHKK